MHSANEPLLISGVGTYAAEIFEDLPDDENCVKLDPNAPGRPIAAPTAVTACAESV